MQDFQYNPSHIKKMRYSGYPNTSMWNGMEIKPLRFPPLFALGQRNRHCQFR